MRYAMKLKAISLSIAVVLLAASTTIPMNAQKRSEPISVGMVALLAAPQNYNGKVIRTWGFLNLRSDDDGLFLHEEDLRIPLLKNSFKLDLTAEQEQQFKNLNLTYVILEGTMRSDGPDSSALTSGTITHITLVHGWAPYVPFETKKPQ